MLIDSVRQALLSYQPLSEINIIIAYSGGVDSHVLLHALHQLRSAYLFQLSAIHVHHGLSKNAHDWVKHCQSICGGLSVPIFIKYITISRSSSRSGSRSGSLSLEAQARELRYQCFKETMVGINDILITAHSASDQAESLLLNLIRGTGLQGLRGIHKRHRLGEGILLRPLLDCTRQMIEAYAHQHNLRWIEDESNQDLVFRRNYIRHKMIPELNEINPKVAEHVARTAAHIQETQDVLDRYLDRDLSKILIRPDQLDLKLFHTFDRDLQKHLLRRWFKINQCSMPSEIKLAEILNQILNARSDTMPCISWGKTFDKTLEKISLRRYQHRLYLVTGQDKTKTDTAKLNQRFSDPRFLVRTRIPGEWIQLPGRSHRTLLKNWFQAIQVPPWEGNEVSLVFSNNCLIAVGDYWADETAMRSEAITER